MFTNTTINTTNFAICKQSLYFSVTTSIFKVISLLNWKRKLISLCNVIKEKKRIDNKELYSTLLFSTSITCSRKEKENNQYDYWFFFLFFSFCPL